MSKAPNMGAFLGSVMGQQATAVVSATTTETSGKKDAAAEQHPRRGRGRPPKAASDLAKQTAIRLDLEDLKRLKKLAVDDDMTFNRLVYLALRDYCLTRGVKLVGVDKK